MKTEDKKRVRDVIDRFCYKNKCENKANKIFKMTIERCNYYESMNTKKPLLNTIIAANIYFVCGEIPVSKISNHMCVDKSTIYKHVKKINEM